MEACAKELAARLLAKVIKRTPVGDYSGEAYECKGKDMNFTHMGNKVSGKTGGTLRQKEVVRKDWIQKVQCSSWTL